MQTNKVYYSPRWKLMLGYEDAELENDFSTWERLVDSDGKSKTQVRIEACVTGASDNFEVEFKMRHKDGRWLDILSRALTIRDADGIAVRMVGTHVDISERKAAERAIADSDNRFRTLFSQSPDPAWIIEGNRFVDCNLAAIAILGYDNRDEFLNSHPSELSPEKQPDGEDSFKKAERMMALTEEQGIHRFEWVHSRKDDTEFFAEVTLSSIQLNDRPAIYCTWRDVTDGKRMQRELLQAQKMQAIGQLTGGIAHDFNNILGVILGYSELAIGLARNSGNKLLIEHLAQVETAGLRARSLISQMLAFSRSDEDEVAPILLEPLLVDDLSLLRSTLPSTIEIKTDFEPDLCPVLLDPTRLNQLLMNLCVNARDAMEERGKLTVRLSQLHNPDDECSSCHKQLKGSWIVLSVSDTGRGIPPEALDRIFDPFFTTKNVGEGTGLGLSVVHGIVHNNGGHLLMESEPGVGTCIRLLLPPDPSITLRPAAKVKSSKKPIHGNGEHLVVLDDEHELGQLMGKILEINGYRATVVTRGQDAIDLILENGSDVELLITDQTMPEMTGIEVVKAIHKVRPRLPAILCSGYPTHGGDALADQAPVAFLSKPIPSATLLERIRALLPPAVQPQSGPTSAQNSCTPS